jgi:uncharacterized membrane protein required for colicin V production
MGLDIVCVVLVLAFLILGLLSGFLSQVVRIAALVGAFLLASPASSYSRSLLAKWMNVETLLGDLLSLFLAWVACYIALILVGTVLVRIIRGSSQSIKFLDRIMGGGLGAVKGFLIVYLIACALVLLREPLKELVPNKYLDLRTSRLAVFAEQHNVFSMIGIPDVDKLKGLTLALGDKEKRRVLINDPATKEIRQNKSFKRLMNDKEFQKAVDRKELSAILNNKSFRDAMNDPQIRKFLSTLDLKSVAEAVDVN